MLFFKWHKMFSKLIFHLLVAPHNKKDIEGYGQDNARQHNVQAKKGGQIKNLQNIRKIAGEIVKHQQRQQLENGRGKSGGGGKQPSTNDNERQIKINKHGK